MTHFARPIQPRSGQARLSRRSFAKTVSIAAASLAVTQTDSVWAEMKSRKRNITKSLKMGMITQGKTFEEKLQVAKDAGFDSVEPGTIYDPKAIEELRKASETVGLPIDAVVCDKHWSHPLSDPDPERVKVCVDSMKVSMQNAKVLGGDMVLLVPAVVSPKIMYKDAYERSLKAIKTEIVPMAEEMEMVVGLENVWNKFLLSPIEFRRYVEEIDSPYVRAWFDVGNVVAYGYPADWIRTLAELIARVDVKDFKGAPMEGGEWKPLREGSVPWNEVMKAFDEIGYEGVFAAEVAGGDLKYLTEVVSEPMDLIIAES
ncbi:MAG: sugar phosphate isomerase/epimerase family protein [bacterium]